ncbi:MAG: methyltransferase FkbM family protein [Parvularcula sp.]|uniref:FkbM family methyltransferase n=1 Tax=Hyphococcus sp. TaxID=2038636 RepID=UPI000C5DEBE1|nr:methyltransferase FkbM family protein [Parvularcula sp.]
MLKIFSRKENPALDHDAALARMAARGVEVGAIIDVGAAKGAWTDKARRHWSGAHAHLLEAKESWRADLTAFQGRQKSTTFEIAGVTKEPGVIYFPKAGDAYGGAVFHDPGDRDDLEAIAATSIDHEVARLGLKGPFAIKLDTHGTEVDILDGAARTLSDTAFLCIETYNLIGQKRFPELILDLQARGFRCADLVEPMFRPSDKLLWQVDFYFMRAEHSCFQDFKYLP